MAEGIGLAASVIAVSQTAWAVAKGLYDLADEVGSAGEAVRIFANDFALFVENLKELGALLDSSPSVPRQTQSVTEDLLEVATDQIVQPFQRLLEDLQPLLVTWRDSPNRMKQLGLRLRWAFSYKAKVLFFHGALNALKGNVSLLLQAMSLKGQIQPHICFILRGSIESTKATLPGNARKPTPRLLQSGQVVIEDRSMVKPTPLVSATSLSIIDTAPSSRLVSDDQYPHTVEAGTVVATDVDDPDDADSASSSQAFAEIYLLADEVPKDQDDNREEQMELWGAIRTIQRKIVRLADEAVAASGSLSGKTDNGGTNSATSVGTTPRETAVTLQPNEKPNSLGPQMEVSGARQDVIVLSDTLGNDFDIPYSAVRSWQAIKAFIRTEYAEVNADINDVLILNEEARRKAFRDAGYDNLLFRNPRGGTIVREENIGSYEENSKFCLRVITPQALVTILDYRDQFVTSIDEEKFTIFYRSGPAGQRQMVLPDSWDGSVKPGWMVELLFDNNELNELKTKFPPSYRRIRCAHMAALRGVSTVGSLSAGGSPSRPAARSVSPGPSLSPSGEGERSQKKGLPGLMRKLGV